MTLPAIDAARAERVARRRAERVAAANAPRGPAAFVWGDFVTAPDTRVAGAPGRWAPLPAGRRGLRVTASAAEGIEIGGVVVDGTAVLHASEAEGPALARFPGAVELDFNETSLLPCAFSLAWNCPIAPPENALPFAVRAGEKNAIGHDGEVLL